MIYFFLLLIPLLGGLATFAWPRSQPVAAPVVTEEEDDDAAHKAAILARIRKMGVAPDDLHLIQK